MKREIIEQLPNWVITNLQPAFYDTESKTVIEEVGRLYAKIRETIDTLNKTLLEIDEKIKSQDETIQEAYDYLKTNIQESIREKINEMIVKGEITVGVVYHDDEEELDIIVTRGENNE